VRAALVAARHEIAVGGGQLLQGGGDVLAVGAGRVVLGTDQYEVVVHDLAVLDAVAFVDELLLRCGVVHEHHVRITAAADVQGLAGTERNDLHVDAGSLFELRQNVPEKAGLLGRRGRGDDDGGAFGLRGQRQQREQAGGCSGAEVLARQCCE